VNNTEDNKGMSIKIAGYEASKVLLIVGGLIAIYVIYKVIWIYYLRQNKNK